METKSELTSEEESVLKQVAHTTQSALFQDLCYAIPCAVVAGYGIWTGNRVVGFLGIGLYLILQLRNSFLQDRLVKPLRSGIRKLLEKNKS